MNEILAQLISRLEIAVAAKRSEEHQMIEDSRHGGGSMPSNYWQARWRAEERLKAAQRLYEALV